MKITFVKKILASGQPCPKCRDVEERLHRDGMWPRISQVLIADERDPASEGLVLAQRLSVDRAPFFVVDSDGITTVYTVYLKFLREIANVATNPVSESRELLAAHPDLDLV